MSNADTKPSAEPCCRGRADRRLLWKQQTASHKAAREAPLLGGLCRHLTRMAIAAAMMGGALAASAEVFKCKTAGGGVTYQGVPCPGSSSESMSSSGRERPGIVPPPIPRQVPDQRPQAEPLQPRIFVPSAEPSRSSTGTSSQRPVHASHTNPPQFGEPVKPVPPGQLPLSADTPPQDLARGAEVVVVSGYEPTKVRTELFVDRPGKEVVLVLTSHSEILWDITSSPKTVVRAVLVSSLTGTGGAKLSSKARGYQVSLPYASRLDSLGFRNLVQQLNQWFGIDKVDVAHVQYMLFSDVQIKPGVSTRQELQLAGVQPVKPHKVFGFDLLASDFSRVKWTNTGPAMANPPSLWHAPGYRLVVPPSGGVMYQLSKDGLMLVDRTTKRSWDVPLPKNFPAVSWATDLAYDPRNEVITMSTLGGEGFLYRFDCKRKQWIDFRSLNNVDITSLGFDEVERKYVAWTSDSELIFMSEAGLPLHKVTLYDKVPDLGSTHDPGNDRPPPFTIVPRGGEVALIHAGASVDRIWSYSVERGTAELTYRRKP